MTSFIYLNGNRVKTDFPLRPVFYGDGVFETFRCKGDLPVYLNKHLDRLKHGADLLSIPYPQTNSIIEYISTAYQNSGIQDANLKICLLPVGDNIFYEKPSDVSILISVRQIDNTACNYSICLSSHKRNQNSVLNTVKSMNYLEKILARREAIEKGFDDAVVVNLNNEITETSSSNIFWIRGKGLYTPSVNCGLLPGITREVVIDLMKELGYQINERRFGLSYMLNSDFVFLTNSITGTIFVNRINDLKMPESDENYKKIKEALREKLEWL